jgi:hypothetical protein
VADPQSHPEQRLSYPETLALLTHWVEAEVPVALHAKKHLIGQYDETGEPRFELRLPLPLPAIDPEGMLSLADYLRQVPEEMPSYVLVLIQIGAAAMGYFEEGEAIQHKAFKKYMKRHKRGKAQISYLNTRGKSKAGSRVRLANTVAFFEEINERLTDWLEAYEPDRILYSCTPQLWGLLFSSQVPPPFEKKDPRLIKVPTNVHIPDFEELQRINRFAITGRLTQFQAGPIPGRP